MNRYKTRDTHLLGQLYFDHVRAMTTEQLHNKCDIAAELAYRDKQLLRVSQELQQVQAELEKSKEQLASFVIKAIGDLPDGVTSMEWLHDDLIIGCDSGRIYSLSYIDVLKNYSIREKLLNEEQPTTEEPNG